MSFNFLTYVRYRLFLGFIWKKSQKVIIFRSFRPIPSYTMRTISGRESPNFFCVQKIVFLFIYFGLAPLKSTYEIMYDYKFQTRAHFNTEMSVDPFTFFICSVTVRKIEIYHINILFKKKVKLPTNIVLTYCGSRNSLNRTYKYAIFSKLLIIYKFILAIAKITNIVSVAINWSIMFTGMKQSRKSICLE